MKKKLLLLVLLFYLNAHSQITFEKGYFIDNSNQKIECLIKNIDRINNPTEIEYKINESNEPLSFNLKSVAEFGIYNVSKYIRCTVKIDISSDKLDEISLEKNPIFDERQFYLKVLVEGKSNLYLYENNSSIRFFYNTENSNIEQLVYKKYMISTNYIAENEQFKQQLWNDLKCKTILIKRLEQLQYKQNSLIDFFIEYNKCNNSDFKNYKSKVKKDLFNLTFRAHFNNSSLTITRSLIGINADFGSKSSIGFGVEAEYILPINKNKWAFSVEPTYQSYKSSATQTTETSSGPAFVTNFNVDYSSIEMPISLRHYLFVDDDSKFFMNISYVLDFQLKSSFTSPNYYTPRIKTFSNLAFGLGYKFKDKYGVELRYQSSRNIINDIPWDSKYSTLSLIFGLSIF